MSRFPATPRGDRHPPLAGAGYTIALLSDLHLTVPDRADQHQVHKMRDDLNVMAGRGVIDAWIIGGDVATNASAAEVAQVKTWIDGLDRVGAPLAMVPGNHDLVGNTATGGPDITSPAQWAALYADYEVTAPNRVVDVGAGLRIIALAPTPDATRGIAATWRCALDAATLAWCGDRLAETTRRCIIAFHAPLQNTVGSNPVSSPSSTMANWYAHSQDAATIEQMIGAHPNVIAWVSGHTHTSPNTADIATAVTREGHTFAAISASSPFVLPAGVPPSIASALLSIYPDRIEVRYRDHGAGQWLAPVRTITL